jgi:hypothetical protein
MPTVACPSCATWTRVPADRIGQTLTCPKCHGRFVGVPENESWTRVFHRRNPVGMWAGVTLLLAAGILTSAVVNVVAQKNGNIHAAIFGHESSAVGRIAFFIAVGAFLLGILLVRRWYRATHRWPNG